MVSLKVLKGHKVLGVLQEEVVHKVHKVPKVEEVLQVHQVHQILDSRKILDRLKLLYQKYIK